MPFISLQPGYWYRTGNAVICSPAAYMKEEVWPLLHYPWVRKPKAALPAGEVVAPASEGGKLALYGTDEDCTYSVQRGWRGALRSLHAITVTTQRAGPQAAPASQEARVPLSWYLGVHGLSDSPLGIRCLELARDPKVKEAVRRFVSEYGPLVRDFGTWCCDIGYGMAAYAVDLEKAELRPPFRLGQERLLWPRKWRLWARAIRTSFESFHPVEPWVPAPIGFYVWAAHMLIALRECPNDEESQMFLSNRLASLRVASAQIIRQPPVARVEVVADSGIIEVIHVPKAAGLEQLDEDTPFQLPSVYLLGELLDYLALAAAYGGRLTAIYEGRPMLCANCGASFLATDGRRRYCDRCNRPCIRDAARAMRYRQRRRGDIA